MPTPAEKELLKRMKFAVLERYENLTDCGRALGVTRWQLRRAVLGHSPGVLRKMEAAGIVLPGVVSGIAANSSGSWYAGNSVIVAACNARAISDGEWEQITPYGDFPNSAGLQRLNKKTSQQMVDAFNQSAASGNTMGVPIFHGHPDVDPRAWPDDRRYGKITALDARSDGLWCKPSWNSLGAENQREGLYVYPSGVWEFNRLPGGVIEPKRLVSVGLTNSPIIKSVQPWAKNSTVAGDDDPVDNPAINSAVLLYRQSLQRSYNSSDRVLMREARLLVDNPGNPTTPGAAKQQAKQALKEHASSQEGYSATTAILKRQEYLRREKGMPEHQALLQARLDLPESAALEAKGVNDREAIKKENERRAKLKQFGEEVNARMKRETCSFAEAWARQIRANKSDPENPKWCPTDD